MRRLKGCSRDRGPRGRARDPRCGHLRGGGGRRLAGAVMDKPPDFDGLFRLLRDAVIVALAILLLGALAVELLTGR